MKIWLIVLSLLIAIPASAQELPKSKLLTAASWTFFAAAQSDHAATFACQQSNKCREADPIFSDMTPTQNAAAGAALDAATVILITHIVGKHHHKVAAASLFFLSALRLSAAAQGIRLLSH